MSVTIFFEVKSHKKKHRLKDKFMALSSGLEFHTWDKQ